MNKTITPAKQLNSQSICHDLIFDKILATLKSFNNEITEKLNETEEKRQGYVVEIIEHVLQNSEEANFPISKKNGILYIYNGAFWRKFEHYEIERFLTRAALKFNVDVYTAKYHLFVKDLRKQLLSRAYYQTSITQNNSVCINLQNGTFLINNEGGKLIEFDPQHYINYQLPFCYDNDAKCTLFDEFLEKVLPDKSQQNILAEYIAYVFIRNNVLKLEKCLVLYGKGANGKSVFFEIINALLGSENISSFNLKSLTNESGYQRASLGNKLLNYSSEISNQMDSTYFKQLVSGEPVEARLPYGSPFILNDYAKFIFNANELPREVEQNEAFFRRFIIIKFDVTIQEMDRDPELSQKIISKELPGVFNWVLEGLDRLLKLKNFSASLAVQEALNEYKMNSDSVNLFLQDKFFKPSIEKEVRLHDFYIDYSRHSKECGYKPVSKRSYADRLRNLNFTLTKKNSGMFVNAAKFVL